MTRQSLQWRCRTPRKKRPACERGNRSVPRDVELQDSAAHPRQPRQHLGAEIRHVVEIVHERHRDAAHAGAAEVGKLLGDRVGRPDIRVAADTAHRLLQALGGILRRWRVLRRDAAQLQHPLDRRPVRVLDVGVVVIVLGLLLRRPADHLAAGYRPRCRGRAFAFGLDRCHLLRGRFDQLFFRHLLCSPRGREPHVAGRGEEGVAVAHREILAGAGWPAFMMSGRVPPNGLGFARTPLSLK